MSHKNKISLSQQVCDRLQSMLAFGQSKHSAKIEGTETFDKIYSFGTYNAYKQQCIAFVKWCKSEYKVKNIDHCRQYINEYLQMKIDGNFSAYTIKLIAASLAKLYQCRSTDFISTPPRIRKNITRSRNEVRRDKRYADDSISDFVRFCSCTGLRRREVTALRGDKLMEENGKYYIFVVNGKGGKIRKAEIIGTQADIEFVIKKMKEADTNKVFQKIPDIDIHSLRAQYAHKAYNLYARNMTEHRKERLILYHNRPVKVYTSSSFSADIENNKEYYVFDKKSGKFRLKDGYKDVTSCYYCRDDKRRICYDRLALLKCSQSLGHNRASVVADHYLWI